DIFTTAQNENASRGQLSVNQTNLASWAAILSGVITLTNTTDGAKLLEYPPPPLTFEPLVIDPIAHSTIVSNMMAGINNLRSSLNASNQPVYPGQVFQHLGDILAVPELTVNSPFLNLSDVQQQAGISDAVYERIPQQILSLLRLGEPRYVIYSYGQSLKPADRSIVQSGTYFGMCTNYQITGEVVTRAVVRVDNYPVPGRPFTQPPRIVVESYTVLPPE
ncbi:MAG: hypothetical protein JWQ71_3015, partial [Pedosphaera sp.]|nr:hypothetical protein [Pedosphaera sp.]